MCSDSLSFGRSAAVSLLRIRRLGVSGSRRNERGRPGQQFGDKALASDLEVSNYDNVFNGNSDNSQPFCSLRSLQNFSLSEWRSAYAS
jgi:hypothetical protein